MKYKLLTAFSKLLTLGLTANKVKRYFKGHKPPPRVQQRQAGTVTAAAVQVKLRYYGSIKRYLSDMQGYVRQAVQQGAGLVVFPELCGQLPLLCLLPARLLFQKHKTKKIRPSHQKQQGGDLSMLFTALLKGITQRVLAVYLETFSTLARLYGVTIMAGSSFIYEDGKVHNRAYLFDENGQLIATQNKAHPVVLEQELGLTLAKEIKVADTSQGRLAFPVCMDATYFETFKIAKGLGAQIVLLPIANQEEYNYYLALCGIEPRIQEAGLYGVKAALVGDIAQQRFTGKAGIFAPCDLTGSETGVLAQATSFSSGEVVVSKLDLTLLQRSRSCYRADCNPAFYEKYYSTTYSAVL